MTLNNIKDITVRSGPHNNTVDSGSFSQWVAPPAVGRSLDCSHTGKLKPGVSGCDTCRTPDFSVTAPNVPDTGRINASVLPVLSTRGPGGVPDYCQEDVFARRTTQLILTSAHDPPA